jgi:hypothetical protein
MPAVPLYVHRLADGIAALESLATDLVDRRTLEEALGVGKWTAWRILKRCGAVEGPGGALVCRRLDLLGQLRRLQQDGRYGPEIARRDRLERHLAGILRDASRRHTEVARTAAAEAIRSTRFGQLPAGVDLAPGELRIRFSGTNDFLQKFAAMVYALNNDFEGIREFIENGSPSRP